MFISRVTLYLLLLALPQAVFGQNATLNSTSGATAGAAEGTTAPKLEHFDPNLVDSTLNPCDDFYKYSCNKWITANPIPADQVYWTTGSSLELWNENVLRETLEANSKNDPNRNAVQQKIGDYWAACMDESGHRSGRFEAFAAGTCPDCGAQVEERTRA
jgi:predicted metalloendopeptidase